MERARNSQRTVSERRPLSEARHSGRHSDRSAESTNTKLTSTGQESNERNKTIIIFQEESGKNDDWNKKYMHGTMFLLGYGAYGSVFQVTTRLYPQSRQKMAKERYMYHPSFLELYASQRRLKVEQHEKLKDRYRHDRLFDTVAIKYEVLEQSQLEDGITRFHLFLRREFLVLDTIWRKHPRLLIGFPAVFDFGYIGDKLQYGVNPKYKNVFTYLNMEGQEVKFFADTLNRNLEGVTKISYMTMELLGPSVEDYRSYFAPWYEGSNIKPFFQVRTAFRIADQLLCRLYMLHKAGFVHHDLKPDNLVVGLGRAMNTIYLIDFGFAKQVSDGDVSEWMGSRKYISVDTYNNERPNYSQDIESWFYLTTALLFDSLPWSDEVILPMLNAAADEGTKWTLVNAIKKTWWGDYSEALTLHSTLSCVQGLHMKEVPDIRQIMEQLHRKVRDLRSHLNHISDSKTMNSEMVNRQSPASKGYMSIRKVLLQIFDLPNIDKNILLGDTEFRSLQAARRDQNLKPFKWDPNNFEWEWDRNHERMVSNNRVGPEDGLNAMRMSTSITLQDGAINFEPVEAHNSARVRRQIRRLASNLLATSGNDRRLRMRALGGGGGGGGGQRADEVSYVYDAAANALVPKHHQGQLRRLAMQRRSKSALGTKREDARDDGEQLWQLVNPSCLLYPEDVQTADHSHHVTSDLQNASSSFS